MFSSCLSRCPWTVLISPPVSLFGSALLWLWPHYSSLCSWFCVPLLFNKSLLFQQLIPPLLTSWQNHSVWFANVNIQKIAQITLKLTRALENYILTEYLHCNSVESYSMKDSLQFVVSLYLCLQLEMSSFSQWVVSVCLTLNNMISISIRSALVYDVISL